MYIPAENLPIARANATKLLAERLSVSYGGVKAIEDVDLTIPERQITAIIGPSGCGKSSFLRALNRTVELVPGADISGQVFLDGQALYGNGVDLIRLRTAVGYIFQKPNPFPASIYENVAYGPRLRGRLSREELDHVVETSLRHSALWDEVKSKLKTSAMALSGGQQQRVCIARALAVGPQVLLMDEPCSALDPISTQRVEDLLDQLKKELAIVIVTHNMQQAARISEQTAFFLAETVDSPGRLIEFGPTSRMFTKPTDKRTEDFITGRFG